MLKSIVNGAEHDIISIPMKGKNLFDIATVENGKNVSLDGSITNYARRCSTVTPIDVSAYSNVTLAFTAALSRTRFIYALFNDSTLVTRQTTVFSGSTIDVSSGNRLYICFYDPSDAETIQKSDLSNIMLNAGIQPLPYEPYGYQEGWEVRDNQDRLIWGREDELQTATGTLPFKGYSLPLKVKSLLGNTVQNGTPAPDNIIMPEMCGMRTGNLFDGTDNSLVYIGYNLSATNVWAKGGTGICLRIPVDAQTQYTISGEVKSSLFRVCACTVETIPTDNDSVSVVDLFRVSSTRTVSFTTPENTKYIIVQTNGGTTPQYRQVLMLNLGSTALPYEPYGWKVPFENHGENLFDEQYPNISDIIRYIPLYVGDGNFTMSTTTPYDLSVANLFLLSGNVDSGSSTPNNGVWKNHDRTVASDNGYITIAYRHYRNTTSPANCKTMLNLGSTPKPYSPYLNATIPVYLGEVPTVRRVRKLVLTGEENITSTHTDVGLFNIPVTDYLKTAGTITNICSHYLAEINVNGWSDVTDLTCRFYGNAGSPSKLLYIRDSSFSTVDDFKSYLTQQYQNGTPVTIWYVLANDQIGISNEPLCKISTYADEITTIQVHGLSAPLYGIGDYKDTLNLSTGVVTRKVKKLVLDGTEYWSKGNYPPTGGYQFFTTKPSGIIANPSSWIMTHFKTGATLNGSAFGSYLSLYPETSILPENASSNHFKNWLAAQYANGTPVTIWYILETPETETVTVPTGMTGEIEGYLTQISTPTPTNQSIPKWNGKEETGGTYAVTVYDLPEIETTTGKNTLTVDTTIAPYDVTINGHIKYTYWGKIREDVRSGLAQTKFPVGTILYDNEDETTGRAFQVVGYDKHFDPSLTARGYNHSMTLCQLKLSGPWQFDATEAFLYTTVEMQPGTYKFKIPNYDTTYGGNKTYYFTSTVSVPVDSQIVLKWDYQEPPASVTAYAGPNPQTNTTAITGFNALQLSEWVEGESPEAIDLGTIKLANNDPDSAYGKLNHIHRARYGSNNYYQSGLRQLLNTDLASNNWWHPTTIFDRPYANRTTNGYLRSLNEDFINVLATPEITHIANNIFEYPSLDGRTFALNTEYKINTDKVFLLSRTEVGLSSSPNVGTILDYYSTHNTNNDRIKYRIDNGNAYYWWFRTPYPTNASDFRYCHTSGALSNNYAGNFLCVAPAHIIQ